MHIREWATAVFTLYEKLPQKQSDKAQRQLEYCANLLDSHAQAAKDKLDRLAYQRALDYMFFLHGRPPGSLRKGAGLP